MGGVEAALAEHAFEHLFIECLGWDRFRSTVAVGDNGAQMELTGVAQKRGFAVFVCPSHRTVLANRKLLRNVQRQIRRSHHEHILIHVCETPRKQVWQWATMLDDGRRMLHREHPFFSNHPPPRLLERLHGLAIPIDAEEQTSLSDVLHRVRAALRPDAELNLFAKHPKYASRSDRLATSMKRGEPGAFGRFVEFHMPLARHFARRLQRWFEMDYEDAEQTAMIGLIEASRRFDPEKGFQFSTFASWWIRQGCQRHGLEWGLSIRLPPHVFWPCYRLTFTRAKLIAQYGEAEAELHFDAAREAAGVTREQWDRFQAARHVDVLSDFVPRDVHNLEDAGAPGVVDEACADELREDVARMLRHLSQREGEVLRLRYGIGCKEHTLQEVADQFGVTRERVRQVQADAEKKLRRRMGRGLTGQEGPSVPPSEQEIVANEESQ